MSASQPHPSVLYREDLDSAHCDRPDCDHRGHGHVMSLVQNCHPRTGIDVTYADGTLILQCHACGHAITQVVVASMLEPGGGKALPEELEDD